MARSRPSGSLLDRFCPLLTRPECLSGLVLALKAWAGSITHAARLRQRRRLPKLTQHRSSCRGGLLQFRLTFEGSALEKSNCQEPAENQKSGERTSDCQRKFGHQQRNCP